MFKFVPVQLTIFLIFGILITSLGVIDISIKVILIVLAVLLLGLGIVFLISKTSYKTSYLFTILTFVLSFTIGISSVEFKNHFNKANHYTNFNVEDNTLVNSVVSIKKVLKSSSYYNKYIAEVKAVRSHKVSGNLLLSIQKDSLSLLEINDVIYFKQPFTTIAKADNPNRFSYKKYLNNKQVFHQVTIYKNEYKKLNFRNKTIVGYAERFRKRINNSLIKDGFKNNELAVINALLLGQRQTVTSNLLDSYSRAGAIHILAVSGLHIGIILLIFNFLFKPIAYFKNGKIIASVLIICCLWLYAIIAGLSPSVVRAVTMFSAVTIGMYLNKPSNIYNTLFISIFFLVLFNPNYLFEVGFQLSYLAVFSIVWLQPKISSVWKPKYKFVNYFWQLFTVSLAAQIGVAPLSIFYFHQFPGLFFISNLVIIPVLGAVLILGFIVIVLSLINFLPEFLAKTYMYILQKLNLFVEFISNQEVFIVEKIAISLILMLSIYLVVLLFFKWVEKKLFYRMVLFLVSIVLLISVLFFEKYTVINTSEFIVFNQSKGSLKLKRVGKQISVFKSDTINSNNYNLDNYLLKRNLNRPKISNYFNKNLHGYNEDVILVIDTLGLYQFQTIKPTIIVLQNSPKINLERVIAFYKPRLIIADGSNYKSYAEKWEQSCIKTKTPFYNTMQKGAFILKENLIIP